MDLSARAAAGVYGDRGGRGGEAGRQIERQAGRQADNEGIDRPGCRECVCGREGKDGELL